MILFSIVKNPKIVNAFLEALQSNGICFLDKFLFGGVLFLYQKEKERKRSSVEWQAQYAKPDEAPYTAFIGSLWESISRPSFRFAKVR